MHERVPAPPPHHPFVTATANIMVSSKQKAFQIKQFFTVYWRSLTQIVKCSDLDFKKVLEIYSDQVSTFFSDSFVNDSVTTLDSSTQTNTHILLEGVRDLMKVMDARGKMTLNLILYLICQF